MNKQSPFPRKFVPLTRSVLFLVGFYSCLGASEFPVTVDSCERRVTFEQAPQRALVNDINLLEMILELGLEQHLVGYSGVSGYGKLTRMLPRFHYVIHSVPEIAPKYPPLEIVLNQNPDFMFAGWFYGFSEEGLTPRKLEKFGIASYELTESCVWITEKKKVSIEDTYRDLINLGKIFGVEERAKAIVKGYKMRIEAIQQKLGEIEKPVRVFVYDSGERTAFAAGGLAITTDLIRLAGGKNILTSIEKSWVRSVAWESVIQEDPEVIVMFDYEDIPQKKAFFRSKPALKNISAVKNNRFIGLPYSALVPGVRNVDTVEILAKTFYPEKF